MKHRNKALSFIRYPLMTVVRLGKVAEHLKAFPLRFYTWSCPEAQEVTSGHIFSTHLSFFRVVVIPELPLTLMTISKKIDWKSHTTLVSGGGEACLTGGITGRREAWRGVSPNPQSYSWWGQSIFTLVEAPRTLICWFVGWKEPLKLVWQPQSLTVVFTHLDCA